MTVAITNDQASQASKAPLLVGARNVPYFTPAQIPAAGAALEKDNATQVTDIESLPSLFRPFKMKGVEFQNRIFVSPMCQYSADPDEGVPTAWHLTHLGGILERGPALTVIESTAVEPRGRITPNDLSFWSDSQIPAYKQLADFAHSQNQKIAIQLAHAGRKASTLPPWLHGANTYPKELGGWPDDVVGPSGGEDERWDKTFPVPKALTTEEVEGLVVKYKEAALRSVKAGIDVIELHGAHGYLIHQFLSPATNKRTDKYGGSFDNRIRFLVEIVDAVNSVLPDNVPLIVRISSTDWLEYKYASAEEAAKHSWTIDQTVKLAKILQAHKVDLMDISSAGNHSEQKIPFTVPHFQTPLAKACYDALLEDSKNGIPKTMLIGTVGGITKGADAQRFIDEGSTDVVSAGRTFLRNPALVWNWADELGVNVNMAVQLGWSIKGLRRKN